MRCGGRPRPLIRSNAVAYCWELVLAIFAKFSKLCHAPTPASISPHRSYGIAPVEVICVRKDARPTGLEIVGFYIPIPIFPPGGHPQIYRNFLDEDLVIP